MKSVLQWVIFRNFSFSTSFVLALSNKVEQRDLCLTLVSPALYQGGRIVVQKDFFLFFLFLYNHKNCGPLTKLLEHWIMPRPFKVSLLKLLPALPLIAITE